METALRLAITAAGIGLLVIATAFAWFERSSLAFLLVGTALLVVAALWDRIETLSARLDRGGLEVTTARQRAAEAAEAPLAEMLDDISSQLEDLAAKVGDAYAPELREVEKRIRAGAERAVSAASGSSPSNSYEIRQRPGDGFVRLECATSAMSGGTLGPLGLLCRVTDPHGTMYETSVTPVYAKGVSGLERLASVDFPHDFDHVPDSLAIGDFKVDWLQRSLFTGDYNPIGSGRFEWQ